MSSAVSEAKTLYYPSDSYSGDNGIDVQLGYGEYRLAPVYSGKGVDEKVERFEYNEKYLTIDKEGRVTPLAAGTSYAYAFTASQRVRIKINVLETAPKHYEDMKQMEALYEKHGSPKESILFFGDSFFDTRGFWTSFYDDFAGYNAFSSAIAATRTTDWMALKHEIVEPYLPSKIFLNIGTNNINDAGDTGAVTAAKVLALVDELHHNLPKAQIYYYGIIKTTAFPENSFVQSTKSNAIVQEAFKSREYATYLDVPSKVNDELAKYVKEDGLHPNADGYKIYTELAKEQLQ